MVKAVCKLNAADFCEGVGGTLAKDTVIAIYGINYVSLTVTHKLKVRIVLLEEDS